jgi:Las17-binding protein actin regulator
MPKRTIHEDVQAALSRLDAEDPGLTQELKKAYGYAVFPSVGKASLLIGGAWGRGEVYERGKVIGYATIAQTTIGVQVGGDTFTEVLVFESKEVLDRFKRGRTAFAANASAVLVKAGAGGSADFEKGVAVYAYSEGGMLLEAAIGGQRFHFQPADDQQNAQGRLREHEAKSGDQEEGGASEEEDQESGLLGKSTGMMKRAAAETGKLFKEHPLAASLIGTTLIAGAGLIAMRVMHSSSDGQEPENEYDEGQKEDEDDRQNDAEDRSEDSGEESQQDDDQDKEGSEQEESPRVRRSRARA